MIPRLAAAVLAALVLCTSIRSVALDASPRADVLVVGGTPAGVAAALAAARRGENVTLVAARPQLGGVLTDATMDQWDLNLAPDGTPVEAGIFSEMYAALGDAFTPSDAARVFRNLLASEPRIHAIFNAQPVAAHTIVTTAGNRIDNVTFERTGPRAGAVDLTFAASTVIDATDDADVAALAGARYDVGRQDTGIDALMQPVTLMFTFDGVDWPALQHDYNVRLDGPGAAEGRRAWGYGRLMRGYRPSSPQEIVRDLNLGRETDGSVSINAIDVLGIDGRSAADLERARAITVADAPHLLAYLRARVPGFSAAHIDDFAGAVYVRETRHVFGRAWLTAADVWDGVVPPDVIGLSSYPLDLHPVTATDRLAFAPVRHVYGVGLGNLIPRDFTNLLLASPSISASHEASGSARVIPTTIEEGEADGAAAAVARQRHVSVAALDESAAAIAALQDDLRRSGAILDRPSDR